MNLATLQYFCYALNFYTMATVLYSISPKIDKTTKLTAILIRFYHGRTNLRTKSGIYIDPGYWDAKKRRVIIPAFRLLNPQQKELLNDLTNKDKMLAALNEYITKSYLTTDRSKVNKQWLETLIDKFHFPEKYEAKESDQAEDPMSLFKYVEGFIIDAEQRKDIKTGRQISKATIQQYKKALDHLKGFSSAMGCEDFNFEDINTEFYQDYVKYLQNVPFSNNHIGKQIKILKTFINSAPKSLQLMADITNFHVFTEDVDTVYLNEEELKKIEDCQLSDKLDKVRDWFLLLAWTGCRYSDSEKISRTDIKDGIITFRQRKTDEKVIIPLHPAVIKILEKYNFQMPTPLSNQRFNEYIKEVAKIAGIDQMETIRKTIGGKIQTERKPKFELIGTHTGRRSFCTNMYLRGIPTYTIMAISGHKTEKSFIKYVRITKEQHAKLMRKAWEKMYITGGENA